MFKQLKYIFNPNKWHFWIIKPKSLNIGYNDARDLVLHTNMQILKDFYEFQISPKGHINWDYDEEHRQIFATIKEILTWWRKYLIYKKNLYACVPADIEIPKNVLWLLSNADERCKAYYDWLDEQSRIELELEQEEDVMLKKLIDIRVYLWD
jgi:hypothetical protein